MITGSVNAGREAVIPVEVLDANAQPHAIEAIVDTGFTGSLTLPSSLIAAWGLPFRGRQQVVLGNGSVDLLDVYAGTVLWNGQPLAIEIDSCDTDPLVGMSLLDGYALYIEVRVGAVVTITALP